MLKISVEAMFQAMVEAKGRFSRNVSESLVSMICLKSLGKGGDLLWGVNLIGERNVRPIFAIPRTAKIRFALRT